MSETLRERMERFWRERGVANSCNKSMWVSGIPQYEGDPAPVAIHGKPAKFEKIKFPWQHWKKGRAAKKVPAPPAPEPKDPAEKRAQKKAKKRERIMSKGIHI